jgi:hypothetical protein
MGALGPVMALTRNDDAVSEKDGQYRNVEIFRHHTQMGQVLDEGIDLRLFLDRWRLGFSVAEETERGLRRSFQFFSADGTAVHKTYLRGESDLAAFESLTARYRSGDQSITQPVEVPAAPETERPDEEIDVSAVGETDILNVLGPYVALEHRLSVEHADDHGQDDTTRVVIDIRNGKPVPLDRMLRDSTVQEAAGEGGIATRRWRHDGYDVIARYDSAHNANALAMRDRRGREWKLGLVSSTFVQIFWLDKPRVDAETRHALARAFNDATAYGERIQQVSRKKSPRKSPSRKAAGHQT